MISHTYYRCDCEQGVGTAACVSSASQQRAAQKTRSQGGLSSTDRRPCMFCHACMHFRPAPGRMHGISLSRSSSWTAFTHVCVEIGLGSSQFNFCASQCRLQSFRLGRAVHAMRCEAGWSPSAFSWLVFWAGLGWLVLICCERKIMLADWFRLAETNKRTGA